MTELNIAGVILKILPGQESYFGADHDLIARHWTPRPGDVCVDAGCGPGLWSLVALAKFACVYAFDPKPAALSILADHARLNGLTNLVLTAAGLWDEDGTLPFYANSFKGGGDVTMQAPIMTLDSFIWERGIDRLDYLVLDVEGAEAEVLRGAYQSICRYRPEIIVEIHGNNYDALAEQVRRMADYRVAREESFLVADMERKES